ncbi:hypothetical protein P9A16_07080 [Shinella sp. 838]|uniref:hypothetical protein n=1 Tax=Shinella sp. 838 TaxID=3038164 RepID=UPI00241518BE|nr:hypothetical protein [Shinella sp. 838]MDG4670880.1 hypothetical protein [Shinella sp. 838]
MTITVKWADGNLKKYEKDIARLAERFPKVVPQEINKVGNKVRTQVVRTLTKQTGLPRSTIVRAVGTEGAAAGKLFYTMKSAGGDIRLRFFKPRETRKGVVAKPWGKLTPYPGTFMKGGKFPKRVDSAYLSPDVWRRLNSSGTRITQQRSGVRIPVEMITGATAEAFDKMAAPLLEQRITKVIQKLLK